MNTITPTEKRKPSGRRTDLRILRDKAIVRKFHELHDVKRKRIDDVLEELEQQHFYIDRNWIYAIIFYNKDNAAYYNSIVNKNKSNQTSLPL